MTIKKRLSGQVGQAKRRKYPVRLLQAGGTMQTAYPRGYAKCRAYVWKRRLATWPL